MHTPDLSDLKLKPAEMLFVQYLATGLNLSQAAEAAGYTKAYGSQLGKRAKIREAMSRVRRAALESPGEEGALAVLCMKRSLFLLTEIAEKSTDDHARIKAITKAMDLAGESPQNQLEDVARALKVLMEGVKRAKRT